MSINGLGGQAPVQQNLGADAPAQANHIQIQEAALPNPIEALFAARENAALAIADFGFDDFAENVQEGFFSKVGRWFSEGHKAIKGDYGLPPSTTVNVNGKEITYQRSELKSMISALPRLERQEARENLAATLQARVLRGEGIAQSVLAGNPPDGNCTEQDAADIMLFLDAKSRLSTGTSFENGSFSIEDPEGRLYEYLDFSDDKYLRSSSHLNSQQEGLVENSSPFIRDHRNTHRGIDFKQGPNTGLPNGLQTVLFAAIPKDEELGTSRRIFMKPETFGCRLNTLGARERFAGATTAERPTRGFSDLKQAIGHAGSFINANTTAAAASSRKERVPTAILEAFENLHNNMAFSVNQGDLIKDEPLDNAQGIRRMIDNLTTIATKLPAQEEKHQAITAIYEFIDVVAANIHEINGMNVRIGNEVVLSLEDVNSSIATSNPKGRLPGVEAKRDELAGVFFGAENLSSKAKEVLGALRTSERLHVSFSSPRIAELMTLIANANTANPDPLLSNELNDLYAYNGIATEPDRATILLNKYLQEASTGLPAEINKDKFQNALLNLASTTLSADQQKALAATLAIDQQLTGAEIEALSDIPPAFRAYALVNLPHIKDAIAGLVTLQPDARALAVEKAMNTYYEAIIGAVNGTDYSPDDTTKLAVAIGKVATKAFSAEQLQTVYARLTTPEASENRSRAINITSAFAMGARTTTLTDVLGITAKNQFTLSAAVSLLEDELNIPDDQRILYNNTTALFQRDLEDTIDPANPSANSVTANQIATAFVKDCIERPSTFSIVAAGQAPTAPLKTEQAVVAAIPDPIMRAAVTKLASQTAAVESVRFLQSTSDFPGGFMATNVPPQDVTPSTIAAYTFNPATGQFTSTVTTQLQDLRLNDGTIIPLHNATYSVEMTCNVVVANGVAQIQNLRVYPETGWDLAR